MTKWLPLLTLMSLLGCYPRGLPGTSPIDRRGESGFDVGPYLVPLAPGKVAVVVKHELAEAPVVEWWIESSRSSTVARPQPIHAEAIAEKKEDLWVATLDELPIDRELAYRVVAEEITTAPYHFRSGRPRETAFRFAAFGDTRDGHAIHRGLIEAMSREEIDFAIHSGDMVDEGGRADEWDLFLDLEAPLIARRPLFALLGNHDIGAPGHFERLLLLSRTGEPRWFVRDWGEVRIIGVDTYDEYRPGSRQYAELESALIEAERSGLTVVMITHGPSYSSGEHGSDLLVRKHIGGLAERYQVPLVISGHDHIYERSKNIRGVTYVVSGSGGAPVYRVQRNDFTEVARNEPHYLLIDVERSTLTVRAIGLSGNTFDAFILQTKRAPLSELETRLSSGEREPADAPLDVGRVLLDAPGRLLELAFVPALPIVLGLEEYAIHRRVLDFLTNDAKTLGVFPVSDVINRSGPSFGATLLYNEPLGSPNDLVLLAFMRPNRDVVASASAHRSIAELDGQVIGLSISYDLDHDDRFYGLGPASKREASRLLRIEEAEVRSSFGLLADASPDLSTELELGWRMVEVQSAEPSPDTSGAPPGLGSRRHYGELSLELEYDGRDAEGWTSRGIVAYTRLSAGRDVEGSAFGSLRLDAGLSGYVPVAPLDRVLFFSIGAASTSPLVSAGEVPLHALVDLGGDTRLRSHPSDRFLDRHGWWGSLEYRYPIFQLKDTHVGFASALFVDVGRVGAEVSELATGPIAYALGLALRAESDNVVLGRFQLAWSPDGARISLAFGEVL